MTKKTKIQKGKGGIWCMNKSLSCGIVPLKYTCNVSYVFIEFVVSLYLGIDLSCQIWGDHIKGDELVGDRHDVALVRGQLHGKDGKLVALQGVLQWTTWGTCDMERIKKIKLSYSLEVALPFTHLAFSIGKLWSLYWTF
jgi:hypothetical protein